LTYPREGVYITHMTHPSSYLLSGLRLCHVLLACFGVPVSRRCPEWKRRGHQNTVWHPDSVAFMAGFVFWFEI